MRRLYSYLYILIILFSGISCSNEENTDEGNIQLEGFIVGMGDRESEQYQSRAISDFAVNTSLDPTFDITRLTGVGNWTLSVNIQDKNNANYPPGNALCTYTGSAWVPQTNLYFPSYKSPHVIARLYPPGWTAGTAIATDQSDQTKLLNQDILVENGSPYVIRPSHNPALVLRHGYTMLNFMLSNVNFAQISSVSVTAGGLTYQPYKVNRTTPEYMVILPVGTANPVVNITTVGGARYRETINISNMALNNCYCAKLIGVELILSSVTVIDWVYGTALEGQYTTVTTYPTFRGNPNTSITVYYDNGLSQGFAFNDRGEYTVKPLGRTITRINYTDLARPVILDRMYVDLRPYLPIN